MLAIKYLQNIIKFMKRLFIGVAVILSTFTSAQTLAVGSGIVVAGLQTESATDAGAEYIEIANNTANPVDVSGWKVQYFSATAANLSSPSRSIPLNGIINPNAIYHLSSGTDFASGLAASGGHIRIVSGSGTAEIQHDLLGWGTAAHPETAAATVAAKGQVYSRKKDANNQYIDTDNNSLDFVSGGSNTQTEPPQPSPGPEPTASYPGLVITELLPDPAAPATDADGEFVEIYNPNSVSISLKDYKIQTGTNYSYSYVLPADTIAPAQYKALYSSTTKLTLSNSGGRARILDPLGNTVYETDSYSTATTGSSWASDADSWFWTTTVTPGAANIIVAKSTSTSSQPTVKSAATTKTSTKSVKAPTATKTSTKSSQPKTATAASLAKTGSYKNPPQDNNKLPINPLTLAAVGVLAVGYIIYEYRQDIANKFSQLRRNRTNRSSTGR